MGRFKSIRPYNQFLSNLGKMAVTLTDGNQIMAVTARMLGEHWGPTRCAYAYAYAYVEALLR